MNELDGKVLDQKSWSFLNLIGQTPLAFTSVSIVTPLVQGTVAQGFLALGVSGQNNNINLDGSTALWATTDNSFDLGLVTNRFRAVFATILDSGTIGSLSFKTNQVTRVTLANTGQLYPATDAAAAQTASGIFAGTGVPNNANGNNGDFYFRSDGGAGTCIYQRRAGAWVATGA